MIYPEDLLTACCEKQIMTHWCPPAGNVRFEGEAAKNFTMAVAGKQERLNTEWANATQKFRKYSNKRGIVFIPL